MNQTEVSLRFSILSDLEEMQKLFMETVSVICKKDYSSKQIEVWISSIKNTVRWKKKLATQYILIAEINSKMVGFASLENNDHLDLFYVHKDFQRIGIGHRLYHGIEAEAVKRNAILLSSDVSETARPFFEKMGFEIITPQNNHIHGVEIKNYKMIKSLLL